MASEYTTGCLEFSADTLCRERTGKIGSLQDFYISQ